MYFIETNGELMGGSGIYMLKIPVPYMLTGNAYSHALQRDLLVSSALNALIIAGILKCSQLIEENVNLHAHMWTYGRKGRRFRFKFQYFYRAARFRGEIKVEEIISSPILPLSLMTEEKKNFLKSQSRLSQLWRLYIKMVGTDKTFI